MEIVYHNAFDAAVETSREGNIAAFAGAADQQSARSELVLAPDGAGGCDGAEFKPARSHQTALPSQKNRLLIDHHPPGNIAHQRRGGLVLIRRVIEVNKRTPHFAVMLPTGAAGHQDNRKN